MEAPRMKMMLQAVLLFQVLAVGVEGWHGLENVMYHCWNISASATNWQPFATCPGINLQWIVEPPDEVVMAEPFNVTYELEVTSDFYSWAIGMNGFSDANGTGITDPAVAEDWCQNTLCPSDVRLATVRTCCVYHVNVHSCSLAGDGVPNGLCGPWIPPTGSIHTHSNVLTGPINRGNWTSTIEGLYTLGATALIAHFKVAGFHFALEKETLVVKRRECGDGICTTSQGEDCTSCPVDCGRCPLQAWEIALFTTMGGLAIIVIVAAIAIWKLYKKRRFLSDVSWVFPPERIQKALRFMIFQYTYVWAENEARKPTMMSMSHLNELGGVTTTSLHTLTTLYPTISCIPTILHDGKVLAVKLIPKKQFSLTRTIKEEVMVVRQLQHRNLCRFEGGCVEVPYVSILTEYCPKGSLADVLQNEDLPLNWSFRLSFATEIARGMAYLHTHGVVHGRLTSSNCVVDDRWTVKITDYGLPVYRTPDPGVAKASEEEEWELVIKERRKQVYRAPELTSLRKATPSADVYAYGVILVEIATRNDPFQDEDISELPADWRPPLPNFQNFVNEEDVCPTPKQFLSLIEECWSDEASLRPTFEATARTLQRLNPNKLGPVDLMMNMMEKYSKDLEELVKKRTEALLVEKKMTDTLLYSMLPKATADILRKGQTVKAEMFEQASIYFSDIVGFTNLAGASSPMEVVHLLNSLYSIFDNILEKYGVYKVETIGDAYMVVSGVPDITPYHAGEIANVALDLVEACQNFVIPHRPEEPLRIRVGLHSGRVAAGVVGIKMPRYCLFGDTVNTASRMESNGEAYKIHMSSATNDMLKKLGGFISELRGSIEVKGKGSMQTWWLTGRTEAAAQFMNKYEKETPLFTEASLSPKRRSGRLSTPIPSRSPSPSLRRADLHLQPLPSTLTANGRLREGGSLTSLHDAVLEPSPPGIATVPRVNITER